MPAAPHSLYRNWVLLPLGVFIAVYTLTWIITGPSPVYWGAVVTALIALVVKAANFRYCSPERYAISTIIFWMSLGGAFLARGFQPVDPMPLSLAISLAIGLTIGGLLLAVHRRQEPYTPPTDRRILVVTGRRDNGSN